MMKKSHDENGLGRTETPSFLIPLRAALSGLDVEGFSALASAK